MRKMNLQFFAEPAGSAAGTEPTAGAQGQQAPPAGQQTTAPQIDYGIIQQMLEGTLAAKEDTALKAYFKQQGLSEEEMKQAIGAFKQQKAAAQPDVTALQTQAAQAQAVAQKAQIENAAILVGVGMGLDSKTIPYVIKLADLSQAVGQDGKVSDDAVKTAMSKVLEDVPGLKPQAAGTTGFIQVGASGGSGQQTTTDDALKKAFGL